MSALDNILDLTETWFQVGVEESSCSKCERRLRGRGTPMVRVFHKMSPSLVADLDTTSVKAVEVF